MFLGKMGHSLKPTREGGREGRSWSLAEKGVTAHERV